MRIVRRLGKILGWLGLILVIIVLATGAGGYLYARRSLPVVNGTVTTPGLSAAVEIRRDRDAVPHIAAQTRQDALFGLGYVHAQDRLWQMEFTRRGGQGRLSEILGDQTITLDRFMRSTQMVPAAQQAWADFPQEDKVDVEAYVAGINAFINAHEISTLPPEFMALRFKPEPWTGQDVMLWAKVLSWGLGGAGIEDELFRSSLVEAVGPERATQLIPDYAPDGLNIIQGTGQPPSDAQQGWAKSLAGVEVPEGTSSSRSYEQLIALDEQARNWLQLTDPSRTGTGSNNWVVAPARSTTGTTLLANDPHLTATIPSRWYVAHLTGGDLDVIGATIPGLPAVVVGRNRDITWGMTSTHLDVVDFFRERLDSTGTMAEFKGQMEPLKIVTETVKVKGQPDVEVVVRISRHGPILSDAIVANRAPGSAEAQLPPLEPLAMQWIGLMEGDRTVGAFLRMNRATDWASFQDALSDYDGPAANFGYGDAAGNIGFYLQSRVPTRSYHAASIPIEGWSGEHEWTGWVPFEEMPHSYNPPEQYIITANNRPFDLSFPHYLGRNWLDPYRADRIKQMIEAKDKLSLEDFTAMQEDTVSLIAQQLLPHLLSLATPQTEQEKQAVEMLRAWDGDMRGDSAEAAIFAAWFEPLPRALIEDDIGARLRRRYNTGVEGFANSFVVNTLRERDESWCDNVKTDGSEDCAMIVNEALSAGLQKLQQRMGDDMNTWRWDRIHNLVYAHQPFSGLPVVGGIFDRSVPYAGTWGTINIGNPALEANFEQYQGPSYRQVIDMGSTENDLFISSTGQSGNALSPHYDDYLTDLAEGRFRPLRFDRAAVERDQESLLRLEP